MVICLKPIGGIILPDAIMQINFNKAMPYITFSKIKQLLT